MKDLIKAIKALSDETRLRILNLLLEKECCVCEVMQVLNISQTRASRNLGILYDAGFLKMRREGLWTLYSLDENRIGNYLSNLMEAVRRATENNKVFVKDREQLRSAKRIGPVCCKI